MDELILRGRIVEGETPPDAQILIATIGSLNAEGATLIFDGQDQPTTKRYKCLNLGRGAPGPGYRAAVLKISGTYVVLGEIAAPRLYYPVTDLPANATTAEIINAINRIFMILRYNGIASAG